MTLPDHAFSNTTAIIPLDTQMAHRSWIVSRYKTSSSKMHGEFSLRHWLRASQFERQLRQDAKTSHRSIRKRKEAKARSRDRGADRTV